MKSFGLIGRELGEYNDTLMIDISNLLLRIFPLIGSGDEIIVGTDLNNINEDEQKDGADNGEDDDLSNVRNRQVATVFSTFDKSRLGYLNLYDFQTVMKCYNIELTDHKALELLCIGDSTSAGLIDMEGFFHILLQIEDELTRFLLRKFKKDVMQLSSQFLVAFAVLLFLLSFVYLGISAL